MKKTKIYDISLPLYSGMVVYPGDPSFVLERISSLQDGGKFNLSSLALGSHTGTHVDAPSHYFSGGLTIDRLNLKDFIGPAKVIEVKTEKAILPEHLENKGIREGDRILFKTRNSFFINKGSFDQNYIYLSKQAADILVQYKVNLIGIDYFSIDAFSEENSPSHKLLLAENIVVLEGLCLENVPEGEYFLLALPLKIKDCDGSPLRAVLLPWELSGE